MLGLTQGELAEKLGFSQGFIGEMERGEKAVERRTELAVMALVTDDALADAMVKGMIERFSRALADFDAESVTLSREEATMTLGLLNALAEQMARAK